MIYFIQKDFIKNNLNKNDLNKVEIANVYWKRAGITFTGSGVC